MNKNRSVLVVFVLSGVLAIAANARPNVILVMADDLGYNDLSCYGSERIKTPVLDRLASEGVRLTSFYAGATVCTPSRMALLTGAYPVRLGWRGGVMGYRIRSANGLAANALTMGDVFKGAGYRTALIGKWHLGDTSEHAPMAQGFDTAFWIKKSNNQTKKLYRGEELIEDPFVNRMLSEQFTREAISFIEANRKQSFFLYLPYTAPHFPAEAHPDWKGASDNAAYGDVVEELDHRMGELMEAVKRCGLDENTLFIFISDNGTEPGQRKWGEATPYRGMKWSSLEGGNRVPGILHWPGVIPAGGVDDRIVASIDLLPTLAAACDMALPAKAKSPVIDGVNQWPGLVDAAQPHARSELLYWSGWAIPQAIRMGSMKLYLDEIKELPDSKQGPVLVDLGEDPQELKNLSKDRPEQVKKMLERARERFSNVESQSMELGGPKLDSPAQPKRGKWL